MTRARLTTLVVALLGSLGMGTRAEAVAAQPSAFDMIEWACAGDEPRGLKGWIADKCSAKRDTKERKACDKFSGSPWECMAPRSEPLQRECYENHITVTVSASVSAIGWEVKGTMRIKLDIEIHFDGDVCKPTFNDDVDEPGGWYVAEAGDAILKVDVKFTGEGSVSFLGVGFGVGFEDEDCSDELKQAVYRKGQVLSCDIYPDDAQPTNLHSSKTMEEPY